MHSRPQSLLVAAFGALVLGSACAGEVNGTQDGDSGDGDAPDAAPVETPDAGPVETPDAAPAPLHKISGKTLDYGTLGQATPDVVPNVVLATGGMEPPKQATSDMLGAYELLDILTGTAFYLRAMPVGAIYVPTVNPPVLVGDADVVKDVHVVSAVFVERQAASAGVTPIANTTLVVGNLTDLAGAAWTGIPLAGIQLLPKGGVGLPVGDGPYFFGPVDVDPNILTSVDSGVPAYGARVGFLNVPTGEYEIVVDYVNALNQPVKARAAVITYDGGGASFSSVVYDPNAPLGVPSFTTDIYPILQKASQGGQDCASCHQAGGAGALLIMNDGVQATYDRLKAAPGVINLLAPAESLLLTKPLYEPPPANHPNATWLDINNPNYIKILLWIEGGAPL